MTVNDNGVLARTREVFTARSGNINLLKVLSFRLVLAIGVDCGICVVLVWQKTRDMEHDVGGVVKPVLPAGLTAVSGVHSLAMPGTRRSQA